MTMVTLSLAQMDVATADVKSNLEKTRHFAAEAKEKGAHLIIFPEMWTTGFDWAYNKEHAEEHGATLDEVKKIAAENSIWIHGSLPALTDGGIANRSVLVADNGELAGFYDKTHLFSLVGEERHMVPGNSRAIIETPWGLVGLAVCYDLRFPELFRRYAIDGAEMVFLPSAFPEPRLAHWKTLVRARAIENQLFMAACNQVGTKDLEKPATFFGNSCLVDPWGEAVIEGESEESLLTAEINLDKSKEIRAYMRVLKDRRPDLY